MGVVRSSEALLRSNAEAIATDLGQPRAVSPEARRRFTDAVTRRSAAMEPAHVWESTESTRGPANNLTIAQWQAKTARTLSSSSGFFLITRRFCFASHRIRRLPCRFRTPRDSSALHEADLAPCADSPSRSLAFDQRCVPGTCIKTSFRRIWCTVSPVISLGNPSGAAWKGWQGGGCVQPFVRGLAAPYTP